MFTKTLRVSVALLGLVLLLIPVRAFAHDWDDDDQCERPFYGRHYSHFDADDDEYAGYHQPYGYNQRYYGAYAGANAGLWQERQNLISLGNQEAANYYAAAQAGNGGAAKQYARAFIKTRAQVQSLNARLGISGDPFPNVSPYGFNFGANANAYAYPGASYPYGYGANANAYGYPGASYPYNAYAPNGGYNPYGYTGSGTTAGVAASIALPLLQQFMAR